jgi:hypothetical protein
MPARSRQRAVLSRPLPVQGCSRNGALHQRAREMIITAPVQEITDLARCGSCGIPSAVQPDHTAARGQPSTALFEEGLMTSTVPSLPGITHPSVRLAETTAGSDSWFTRRPVGTLDEASCSVVSGTPRPTLRRSPESCPTGVRRLSCGRLRRGSGGASYWRRLRLSPKA